MVGVVADEGEVVVALARPLVQAALDVARAADLQEDGGCACGTREAGEDGAGWPAGWGGSVEEGGCGGLGGRGRGGGCEPEHVDVAGVGGWGEGFCELGEEEGRCLGGEGGGDEGEEGGCLGGGS